MASIWEAAKLTSTNGIAPKLRTSSILHPSIRNPNPVVVSAKGNYLFLENGQKLLEAAGGPAVTCLGHGNVEVRDAVIKQMDQFSYCHSLSYSNSPAEELAQAVVESTGGVMSRATIMTSGSEAVEAALKLARQYFIAKGESKRTRFIARKGAFHGTTLGSLALTAKPAVQTPFEPLLFTDRNASFVSMPNTYRDMRADETEADYVLRLAAELEAEFQRVGPDTVCAFVAETVGGSSMGCVTAPPGYFKVVREICDKYSALLILDEVMCGMGRTGAAHAWQQEGASPDIQTVAKGLCGGYAPLSMLLMTQRIVDDIETGTGYFNHGHTFSSHAVTCAAGVAVQRIIKRDNLIANVALMGKRLGAGLRAALADHPNVGDIRGRGLMWAIEFVKDKKTKEPFEPRERVAIRMKQTAMSEPWNITLYPGMGTADGVRGDHVMIAPAYIVTGEDIDLMVRLIKGVVEEVLGKVDA